MKSMPPINTYKLMFVNIRLLRGTISSTEFSYQQKGAHQQEEEKEPTIGHTYMACLSDKKHVKTLVEVDNDDCEEILQRAKMPLGWSKQLSNNNSTDDTYISPWPESPEPIDWHNHRLYLNSTKCSKSGRPLLVSGDDVTLECEPVESSNFIEFANPDGDGLFKLTVTNTSDETVQIPALLRDPNTKEILWEESVYVITNTGNHFFPGFGHARETEATELGPKESVSAVLDTLTLKDMQWPQGGWRLQLTFCLGEKASDGSFYYIDSHHDAIRKVSETKKSAVVK